jgi:hypothetical protein
VSRVKSKVTEYPWKVGSDPELEGFFSIWAGKGGTSAELAGRIGERANANMMAAAKDLYEALKNLVYAYGGDVPHWLRTEVEAADKAMAKARGGRSMIPVQALDGRWNFAPPELVRAMESEEHGTFPTEADARAAIEREHNKERNT